MIGSDLYFPRLKRFLLPSPNEDLIHHSSDQGVCLENPHLHGVPVGFLADLIQRHDKTPSPRVVVGYLSIILFGDWDARPISCPWHPRPFLCADQDDATV